MKPALFLFNDFETTGTDLKLDKILEGYFDLILMDPDNGVTFHSLFSQHALIDSEYDRSTLHPIVEDMHTKNGLWDDLAANADNLVRIETSRVFTILSRTVRGGPAGGHGGGG